MRHNIIMRNKVILLVLVFCLISLVSSVGLNNDNLPSINKLSNSIYNATYNLYAYNMTITGSSSGSSYNETYNNYCINYSLITPLAVYNDTYNIHVNNLTLHNHTLIYNFTLITPSSIFNTSYDSHIINQTIHNNTLIYNHTITSNLSIWTTYGKWFYNQTNIIKANSITCSGTDKISSYSNTSGTFTCASDQTGLGGSSTFKKTNSEINSTVADAFKWKDLGLTFSLSANTNYSLNCILWVSANATTTGVQLNLTIPNSPTIFNAKFEHPTTATANAFVTCAGVNNNCYDNSITSVANPATLPVEIYAYIQNVNAGNLNLSMRTEINKSTAIVKTGSFCNLNSELS